MLRILQLIRENLKSFGAALSARKPLFQVDTLLAVPEVILHPTTNEIFRLVMECVRNCVEGYEHFCTVKKWQIKGLIGPKPGAQIFRGPPE